MYLSQGLISDDDHHYPFTGILPFWTKMGTRVKLGYRQVKVINQSQPDLFPHNATIRGHRFHYSDIVDSAGCLLPKDLITGLTPAMKFQYDLTGWRNPSSVSESSSYQDLEGYRIHNVLASYIHLHFGSNPDFPIHFVRQCHALKRS